MDLDQHCCTQAEGTTHRRCLGREWRGPLPVLCALDELTSLPHLTQAVERGR